MSRDEFFPDSPRVFYEKAPLVEVVCQLRFPSILRIDAEIPSAFQDRVRSLLPIVEKPTALAGQLGLPPQIMDAIAANIRSASYNFLSEDRSKTVQLSSGSITCVTSTYNTWDEFSLLCDAAINALVDVYSPTFYSRIGLRYRNIVDRSAIGLAGVLWEELLSKPILAELGEHFIENNVEAIQKVIRVRNSDGLGGFLLQHGIMEKSDRDKYFIDFDFYADRKTELQNAKYVLDTLHKRSGLAWRWCITDKLHAALVPHPI